MQVNKKIRTGQLMEEMSAAGVEATGFSHVEPDQLFAHGADGSMVEPTDEQKVVIDAHVYVEPVDSRIAVIDGLESLTDADKASLKDLLNVQ
jgi:hypothetical protein